MDFLKHTFLIIVATNIINFTIEINDTVVTSGLNEMYPKGLIIGSIIEIGNEFSNLSRFAIIKPAVNLFNIEEVFVIIS